MFKKNVCVAVFLIILVSCVFAQRAQELRSGVMVSGSFKAGEEITYSYKPSQAGFLTVETIGEEVDTFMTASNDKNIVIKEDDDSGESLNAKIEIIVEEGRTYYFVVKGYDGNESGSFRIIANLKPISNITELRIGSPVPGNLISDQDALFRIRAARASFLAVETLSDLDMTMEAYDENLNLISDDDDGGEDYNPRIEIGAEANKTYFFRVRGYDSGEHGPFRIIASTRPFPTPVQLRVGQFQSGNISFGESYWFSVQPSRTGRLAVETTGDTDTYMEAYTSGYSLIASNDDGENLNAKIVIDAEANQTYIFRVRGYDESISGAYRIVANFE